MLGNIEYTGHGAAPDSLIKLPIEQLERGMYVANLDRPCLETPYLMEGFYIRDLDDIEELARHCEYVYIDSARGRKPMVFGERCSKSTSYENESRPRTSFQVNNRYDDLLSMEEELGEAKVVYSELASSVSTMMDSYHNGSPLEISDIKVAVEPMVNSVIRNPDACTWLARLKDKDNYTYRHSVGASIWAVALGRQIGLPKTDLKRLATGALLFDIGKLKLPKHLLTKRGKLTHAEFDQIKSHVDLGVEMLREAGGVSLSIIEMVATHHERHAGHGYPNGLTGDDIPVFGRIAAIADCYDAITSARPYANALSPSAAVKKLYEWRDIDFQAELVEEFIRAIGLYPAGTLVELTSGEVAVVIAEYRTRRLRPQVLVVLDRAKKPLPAMKVVDMLAVTETEDGKPLEISRSLESGAYGINPEELYL
jgi:putative nucleotidyltransferase with HDIG domain